MLGFETCNLCDNLKVGELLVSHIMATRRLKGFELSMAVVIVESNLPGVATDVARHLAQSHVQNVISMREDREPYHATEIRAGSRTNEQNRVAMIEMFKKRLEEKHILIHKDFVVSRPEYSMYPDVEAAMFQQLSSFTLITVVNPRDVTARPKKVYTGKISGGKDDAVLSLSDNCYHHAVFMTEERYAMYRTSSA
jgi:hypothetical protein